MAARQSLEQLLIATMRRPQASLAKHASKFKTLDTSTGESHEQVRTIDASMSFPSQEGQMLLMKLEDKEYQPTISDIRQTINNIQHGYADLRVFEHFMGRLIMMPINWHRRTTDKVVENASARQLLPETCPGIVSPTSVVKIVTTWEIFENADGTRQYVIKDDSSILDTSIYATTLISDLTVEIPVIPGVEYHETHLSVVSKSKDYNIQFEPNGDTLKATIPGVVWMNYDYFKNKIRMSISMTGPKEASKSIALMEIIYRFKNVILTRELKMDLDGVLDGIQIENVDGVIRWINHEAKKDSAYPPLITYVR